ncbi:MAG: DUF2800 domain-containing protein [Patescibacteria group bacterium]
MERLLRCPGSLKAEEGLPDIKSDAADSGTKIHNALRLLFQDMKPDEAEKVCQLNDRELSVAKWFFNVAKKEIEKHGGAARLYPEFKFPDESDGFTGTADLVVRCNDSAVLLFDWKTGYGKQLTADKNLQLRTYAVLTAETFGCISVLAYLFSVGNAVEDSAFSCSEYGPDEIAESKKELYAIKTKCLQPDAPRITGKEQCQWCKASGNPERCPESMEFKKQISNALAIRTPLTPSMRKQCADIYDQIKAFEKAAKNFKQLVKDELHNDPNSLPGLRLEPAESVRKITNPEKVFEIGVSNGWFSQTDFVSKVITVKIGELVKLVKANLKVTQKEATETVNSGLSNANALKFEEKEPSVERVEL